MRLLELIEDERTHLDSATMVAKPQLSKLGNCASAVQHNLTGHIDTSESAGFPTTEMSSTNSGFQSFSKVQNIWHIVPARMAD